MVEYSFDTDTTAVVVVDMQVGFCDPSGNMYAPGSEAVADDVRNLVTDAQTAGAHVVYTRDVHPPDQFDDAHYYDEFERWGEHVRESDPETELIDGLEVRSRDHVVVKHTYDAFHNTELDGWLRAHGIDDLIFCGTLANVCVLHTAGSAGLRDYRPVLIEDAIGAIESDHREYALEHSEWLFGEVCSRADIDFV
ncbi:cysteine hydrolase family protein [Haloquadratum walsbyi]|jgi:Amidases related to nicotinamidase|uniref:Nicotinamidase-like amidase n=1 Tax=Haloquadratum walsbyi J07HQW2 TaxID=1238425 RepID=U1NFY7_9EURY|nr:cysteine hydrolase [Haloquadratum walsbyi]ERG96015.1 MAG: nicotinamidase-like amidase [Haloquadratum walsbyi J07HQW2]